MEIVSNAYNVTNLQRFSIFRYKANMTLYISRNNSAMLHFFIVTNQDLLLSNLIFMGNRIYKMENVGVVKTLVNNIMYIYAVKSSPIEIDRCVFSASCYPCRLVSVHSLTLTSVRRKLVNVCMRLGFFAHISLLKRSRARNIKLDCPSDW